MGSPSDSLTLDQAYRQARAEHPLGATQELQARMGELQAEMSRTGAWPVVMLNGQASWQSEVTGFPVSSPAFAAPELSKDQYKVSLDVQHNIWQTYRSGLQQELDKLNAQLEQQQTEVTLYQVQSQVNQLYFGILLQQKRKASTQLLIEELQQQIDLTRSRIEQGIVLPGALYTIKAEMLQARQQLDEIESRAQSFRTMMAELTGDLQWQEGKLKLPKLAESALQTQPEERPERTVFDQQRKQLDLQTKVVESQRWPEISAFGTAAYGRPGFDVFNDDLHEFFMVGVKAKWNLWSLRDTDKQEQVLALQKRAINHQEASFDQQLATQQEEILGQVRTARKQMEKDEQIIQLRKRITRQTEHQLEQGVVTTSDYISELRKEHQARLSHNLHQVQLQWALASYATKMGIQWYE
jgi:outer membrane protein TolC